MTLTDFLLARIAEDEDGPFFNEWHVGRVRAECEAKRRIVDLFPHAADGDGWNNAGESVLELLALTYADHPDYDNGWRP